MSVRPLAPVDCTREPMVMELILAVNIQDAARITGVSRDTIERALARRELVPQYPNSKPTILVEKLSEWLKAMPTERP